MQFDHFVSEMEEIVGYPFDRKSVRSVRDSVEHGAMEVELVRARASWEPLFSVLVPSYNQAQFVGGALDSLIAQTYGRWEAIVVNDGSTDNTASVLEAYAARDSRIRVIHQANAGTAGALNTAIHFARGEWICWLSSDDAFLQDKLSVHRLAIVSNPQAEFFHTDYFVLDEKSGKILDTTGGLAEQLPAHPDQLVRMFNNNFVNGISVCFKRALLDRAGYFNAEYRHGQDYDLWLRMASLTTLHFIKAKTCVYRSHAGQGSAQTPDTGIFDSAMSASRFMDEHNFEQFFPLLNFTSPQDCVAAVKSTLAVLAHQETMLHRTGTSLLLAEKMLEWLMKRSPVEVRNAVVKGLLTWRPTLPVDAPDLGEALGAMIRSWAEGVPPSVPRGIDGCKQHITLLESRGASKQAQALASYLKARADRSVSGGRSFTGLRGKADKAGIVREAELDRLREMVNLGKVLEALTAAESLIRNLESVADAASSRMMSDAIAVAGDCFARLGQKARAREAYEKSLTLHPESSVACVGLGALFHSDANLQASKTMYEWAVKNDPSSAAGREGLAAVNRLLGLPVSDNTLLPPDDTLSASLDEVNKYLEVGDTNRALEALVRLQQTITSGEGAALHEEELSRIHVLHGRCQMVLGNLEAAKSAFEQALHADQGSAEACSGLGEVFLRMNEYRASKTMFEWALKNGSSSSGAEAGLARANKELGLDVHDNSLSQSA
jgi:tetratricopeptide (TPR) repeat protein